MSGSGSFDRVLVHLEKPAILQRARKVGRKLLYLHYAPLEERKVYMGEELEIQIGGVKFIAELLEREASKTCKTILEALPIESKALHHMWSGEGIYVPMPSGKVAARLELENSTVYPSRGDVGWYSPEKEIFIIYGRARWHTLTGPAPCNVFARISENLKELREIGIKIHREGAKKARIKLK